MKTANNTRKTLSLLQGIIRVTLYSIVLTNPARAGDSPSQTFPQKKVDLVLTLPSQWQAADTSRISGIHKLNLPNADLTNDATVELRKSERVNVGCKVGTYEASVTTATFTNRMEGDCKLNYRY